MGMLLLQWAMLQSSIEELRSHMLCAAAAAKSHQSCLSLCDPIDGSPPGSPSLGFSRQEYWSGVPLPSLTCCVVWPEKEGPFHIIIHT